MGILFESLIPETKDEQTQYLLNQALASNKYYGEQYDKVKNENKILNKTLIEKENEINLLKDEIQKLSEANERLMIECSKANGIYHE